MIRKRRKNILWHILLPIVLILVLIQPACSLVFWHFADQFAHYAAASELGKIQEPLTALIGKTFSAEPEEIGAKDRREQIRGFLLRAQTIIEESGANAEIIVYESQGKAVYPKHEEKREQIQSLIEECQKIQSTELSSGTLSGISVKSETGTYLTDFYEIPGHLPQISCVAVTCSVSRLTLWLKLAVHWIFLLSSILVCLCLLLIWHMVKGITVPLEQLCLRAKEIWQGDFTKTNVSYDLYELENLRTEMNHMAEQLKRSQEIQKDFFQNVSHELRNPLMSISGYAQGIEHGIFKEPETAAHTILEESGRLTELVTSLLTLSRIESRDNGTDISLQPVPLDEVLEDCLDRVSGLAVKKGIQVQIAPYEEEEAVLGDGELICKVLENFLTNALRYAISEVTIRIRPEKKLTAISVEDDGNGIASKDLPHLFERCYKGNGGNFGIGLAIDTSAAERMKGSVKGENRPEGGAVFTLTLQRSS